MPSLTCSHRIWLSYLIHQSTSSLLPPTLPHLPHPCSLSSPVFTLISTWPGLLPPLMPCSVQDQTSRLPQNVGHRTLVRATSNSLLFKHRAHHAQPLARWAWFWALPILRKPHTVHRYDYSLSVLAFHSSLSPFFLGSHFLIVTLNLDSISIDYCCLPPFFVCAPTAHLDPLFSTNFLSLV